MRATGAEGEGLLHRRSMAADSDAGAEAPRAGASANAFNFSGRASCACGTNGQRWLCGCPPHAQDRNDRVQRRAFLMLRPEHHAQMGRAAEALFAKSKARKAAR